MAQNITTPNSNVALSATLPDWAKTAPSETARAATQEHASEGIEGGFGLIRYMGKTWSLSFKGATYPFMRPDGSGPCNEIEVVVVRASTTKSKVFFPGWKPGSRERPACWSNDAIRPDPTIPNPVSPACGLCPNNKIGSRTIEGSGKPAKACSDFKRLAVVLSPSQAQSVLGHPLAEPVLLRIPAASLTDFGAFGDMMDRASYSLRTFVMGISFDPTVSYPRFKFRGVRKLSDDEIAAADILRNSSLAYRIIGAGSGEGEAITHQPPQNGGVIEGNSTPPWEAPTQPAPVQQQAQAQVQQQAATQKIQTADADLDARIAAMLG